MIGIRNIGIYIPKERISNLGKCEKHKVSKEFLERKTGIVAVSRKDPSQHASDLCVLAYKDLLKYEKGLMSDGIEFICVCTQNGDYQLPQTSAIVQAKLEFETECAAFDISLGCSGYVYALHIAKSFMEENGFSQGLLFTSDPYSEIIDSNDKNTDLLFGDGATVTLLTKNPVLYPDVGVFKTDGANYRHLIKENSQMLIMNGRGIYDFAMKNVPIIVEKCLDMNSLKKDDVDLFVLHQASKYIIDHLCRRMRLDARKVPFVAKDYGNTVSSSIPIILKNYLNDETKRNLLICGFGVGLSIASSILRRI